MFRSLVNNKIVSEQSFIVTTTIQFVVHIAQNCVCGNFVRLLIRFMLVAQLLLCNVCIKPF